MKNIFIGCICFFGGIIVLVFNYFKEQRQKIDPTYTEFDKKLTERGLMGGVAFMFFGIILLILAIADLFK